MNPRFALAISISLLALTGCKAFSGCSKPGAYATAEDLPPLKVPVGMDGPDTRAALVVPPLQQPEIPLERLEGCLEEPPPMVAPPPGSTPSSGSGDPAGAEAPQAVEEGERAPPRRRPQRRPGTSGV